MCTPEDNLNDSRKMKMYSVLWRDIAKDLENDLDKVDQNREIVFSQILDITSEEKRWGTLLKVKVKMVDKSKTTSFQLLGWVKYPAKVSN